VAKMLPVQFDVSTASAAERKLFDLLKNDPDTKDWIVLHSLGLARRGKKPYGEIDFVVLIPAEGVFCLEVKGGRIACQNGEWATTNRLGQTEKLNRSPFLQAREGMAYFNSLRELGHAATLIRADIREHLNAVWDRLNIRKPAKDSNNPDLRRFINRDLELTSRIQSSEITDVLQQLFKLPRRF
jgi:Nuclease-related domain